MSDIGPPLRVGIVGAGIGVNYAEAFQRVAGADVVAICASTRRRAGPAAARLGIAAIYTDLTEMLARERLDVVAIATPNDLHHPMALAALRAGAHVLCDKPLAMNAAQALEMLREAESRGRRHIVPFWWRFLPVVTRAREIIRDGSFGEPFFADVRYLNCGWGDPHGPMRWQFDLARAGAGAMANVGSHAIAVLQWLVGDLVEVCARAVINVPERRWPDGSPAQPDGEDTAAMVGVLDNGAPVAFLASSVAHEVRSTFDVIVHFSQGSVTVGAESHWPDRARGRLSVMRSGDDAPRAVTVEEPEVPAEAGALAPQDAAYTAIAAELVAAIGEGRPAASGFDDGLRVQRVIDAAVDSAHRREWVRVDREAPVLAGS
jgi:predicted dehydrogenase